MKKTIREKINAALTVRPVVQPQPVGLGDEYYRPQDLARKWKLSVDTIKDLFRNETEGIMRIGNHITTQHKRRYVTESYSKTTVDKIERLLLAGKDPRNN